MNTQRTLMKDVLAGADRIDRWLDAKLSQTPEAQWRRKRAGIVAGLAFVGLLGWGGYESGVRKHEIAVTTVEVPAGTTLEGAVCRAQETLADEYVDKDINRGYIQAADGRRVPTDSCASAARRFAGSAEAAIRPAATPSMIDVAVVESGFGGQETIVTPHPTADPAKPMNPL